MTIDWIEFGKTVLAALKAFAYIELYAIVIALTCVFVSELYEKWKNRKK